MFTPKTVDTIVGNIQKQITELKSVADSKFVEADDLQVRLLAARQESERAERLATKFAELIA